MKLPEGWKEVELENLVDKTINYPIGDGDHGQINPDMYLEEGVPYIRVQNLSDGKELITKNLVYISEEVHNNNLKSELKPGDILIGKTGSIGKTCLLSKNIIKANTTSSVGKITVDKNKILPEYLIYFFRTPYFKQQMFKVSKKTSQPGFNIKDLKKFKILVPSIEIQKKVISKLEKAEQAKEWRKEADELTKEFLKSVFLEMFGDPVKNPKNIRQEKGKELFKFSSGKFNPTSNLKDSYDYPTYGGNGITGYSKDFLIEYPTLVIGRVGAYCGSIHKTPQKSWITDNAIYIKKFKKEFNLEFLHYLFDFLKINRFALTVGQPKITQKPIEELEYLAPPISLQNKFASIVKEVEAMKEQQKYSKEHLDNLFNVLMQRAFKGELI